MLLLISQGLTLYCKSQEVILDHVSHEALLHTNGTASMKKLPWLASHALLNSRPAGLLLHALNLGKTEDMY